jgi:DNA polymerase-1
MTSAKKKKPKLLLIDCYSLAFRAFYALPEDLQTTDGTQTNAVFGFTSMLIKLLQEERPDHIACCLDMGAPLARTEEYAEYKSNRTEAPDTFSSQVPLIMEVLKVLRIPVYGLEGHEADDIIAYLARRAAEEKVEVKVVTGDRDFFQIVNTDIHVLYNRRGITDIVEMDPAAVEERYGVPPSRYVDLKALDGDPSDNLPGVPGVGTKTAAKLVQKYGSAEEAVLHASEQTPKLAENLAAHAEQVSINKKISTLQEVPLDHVGVSDLNMGEWDLEQIRKLFISLEFRVLLERLLADIPETAEGEGEPFEVDVRAFETPDELKELASELKRAKSFAMDLIQVSPRGAPRSIAFATEKGSVAFVPMGPDGVPAEAVQNGLGPVLADEKVTKVMHGARPVLLSLGAIGIDLQGLGFDTAVGAYLLDPGAPGYPLEEVARRYTGRELKAVDGIQRDEEESPQGTLDLSDEEAQGVDAEDACVRALAVLEIAEALEPELGRLHMSDLYGTIEHPLIGVLARMEGVGVRVDLEYLSEIATDLDKRVGELEAKCYEHAGERLNLGSPPQLRTLLYEKLKLKTTRRTKTGLSTDARALQALVGEHPFVQTLLDYRELAKLKNTYIDALPPLVDKADGRIHTTYDQTVAATGRLSSTNPNLMNIPVRTEVGMKIRKAFVPEEGMLLLSADYSQIELRVMAHLSEDPTLIEVFDSGEDIHAATAARVFDKDAKDLDTKERSVAKMVNYGLAYGMGAPGLADRLNVPVTEARDIMDSYFEVFDGVAAFLEEVVKRAHTDGFTTTMFGRRRYLPELGSGNPRVRAIGERQALNAPIQGSAADIMKLAMIAVDRDLRSKDTGTRMILTVHDELLFEMAEGERDTAAELVTSDMVSVCRMKVPLEVDLSFGETWADAKN